MFVEGFGPKVVEESAGLSVSAGVDFPSAKTTFAFDEAVVLGGDSPSFEKPAHGGEGSRWEGV